MHQPRGVHLLQRGQQLRHNRLRHRQLWVLELVQLAERGV